MWNVQIYSKHYVGRGQDVLSWQSACLGYKVLVPSSVYHTTKHWEAEEDDQKFKAFSATSKPAWMH